jgi:hypothetical protein
VDGTILRAAGHQGVVVRQARVDLELGVRVTLVLTQEFSRILVQQPVVGSQLAREMTNDDGLANSSIPDDAVQGGDQQAVVVV